MLQPRLQLTTIEAVDGHGVPPTTHLGGVPRARDVARAVTVPVDRRRGRSAPALVAVLGAVVGAALVGAVACAFLLR